MELLYLYIGGRESSTKEQLKLIENKPYKSLKNVEFNFSSEFDFELNLKKKYLKLKNKKSSYIGFFDDKKKISNISAFVGKNGTGKSSILEFIKSIKKDNLSNIPYKFVAIFRSKLFKEGKMIKESFRIYHHNDLEFEVIKEDTVNLHHFEGNFNNSIKYSTKNYDRTSDSFNFSDSIYYSGVFEPNFSAKENFMYHSDQNAIDISTTGIIEKDAETYGNFNTNGIPFEGLIRRHLLVDIERCLDFIYTEKSKTYLDFKLPEYLKVEINSSDEALIKLSHKGSYDSLISAFEYQIPKEGSSKAKYIYYLNRAIVFNLIRYYSSQDYSSKININRNLDHVLKKDLSTPSIIRFIESINNDILTGLRNSNAIRENSISTQLKFYLDFILSINSFRDEQFVFHNLEACFLIIERNTTEVRQLFNHYKMAFSLSGVLNFEWQFNNYSNGQLSSGEKSLLSFYSRLFSIRQKDYLQMRSPISYLILIDEGEQMMHPEWQRKFIYNIIKFCTNVFDYVPIIQIILTTHSPFIASDLPPESIIRLSKEKKSGLTKVKRIDCLESTFASNIHELFTDKFYLENGLIGEFAKKKILALAKKLNRTKIITNRKFDYFIGNIEIIGEPYIKSRLTTILKSKCIENPEYLSKISQMELLNTKKNMKKFNVKNNKR